MPEKMRLVLNPAPLMTYFPRTTVGNTARQSMLFSCWLILTKVRCATFVIGMHDTYLSII